MTSKDRKEIRVGSSKKEKIKGNKEGRKERREERREGRRKEGRKNGRKEGKKLEEINLDNICLQHHNRTRVIHWKGA